MQWRKILSVRYVFYQRKRRPSRNLLFLPTTIQYHNYLIKKPRPVIGRGYTRVTTCYNHTAHLLIHKRDYMRFRNGEQPSLITYIYFTKATQKWSSIDSYSYRLTPCPARCDFGKICTVFVKVFRYCIFLWVIISPVIWNCQGLDCKSILNVF